MKPGNYALGSPQSRAAARSLLVDRKASEEDQLRFQVVSMVDGSRVNFDGLAETIRAGRMRARGEESPAQFLASERGLDGHGEMGTDCLSERIRRARERVRRAQGQETMTSPAGMSFR
jgi:hypothetical protein